MGPEPTIIWVKMIKRPFIKFHPFPHYNTVVELANKFNNIVDQETKKSRFAILISPDIRMDAENFDNLGNLSFLGKTRFWKFIDAEIRSLDKDKNHTHKHSLHSCLSPPPNSDQRHHLHRRKASHFNRRHDVRLPSQQINNDIWGEAGRRSRIKFK